MSCISSSAMPRHISRDKRLRLMAVRKWAAFPDRLPDLVSHVRSGGLVSASERSSRKTVQDAARHSNQVFGGNSERAARNLTDEGGNFYVIASPVAQLPYLGASK